MVTQRFWSSAIYLATSNSHASGIVGPRHDHMAIIHRQAIDKPSLRLGFPGRRPCGQKLERDSLGVKS